MDTNSTKSTEFQERLKFAIRKQIPLVEKRSDQEKKLGVPDTARLDTKRFDKLCTKDVWNPTSIKVHQRELESAQFIIKNFEVHVPGDTSNGVASHDQSETGSHEEQFISQVPTLTFGDLKVPLQFAGKCHPLDTDSFNRKYILLSDQSSPEKVYKLLTEVWGLPEPNVLISFTSGSVEHNEPNIKEFICDLHYFCKSTGAWIFTNGLHTGVSQLIGRTIQADVDSNQSNSLHGDRETTLIAFCDWDKLGDKTLLHGVSLQNIYSSNYFYHIKQELGKDELKDLLSPFQHASLLVQSKHPLREEHQEGELRSNLETYLQNKIPVVKCVIGGGVTTVDEIRTSVKSSVPVVIIADTGKLPKCLAHIYQELENVLPGTCDPKPDLTQVEKDCIDNLLSNDPSLFRILGKGPQARLDVEEIMRYRYYISVLELSSESNSYFQHLVYALYKPYTPSECMQIALSFDNIDFLDAIFVREMDQGMKSSFTDTTNLIALHRVNLERNAKLFDLVKYRADDTSDEHILPLVGSLLFDLAGVHYQLMYQDDILDFKLSSSPREQFWHLFIYTIFANKPVFAEYFLYITRCPLGAALFAHKLFKSQARCARQKSDNDKADSFEASVERFQNLAVRILDVMYQSKPEKAYVSLTREVPFDLGPYVTPLSMAVDGEAMKFIQTACVQTYLQRVWVKNMELSETIRWILPVVPFHPMILPCIHFQETKTPAQYVAEDDIVSYKDPPISPAPPNSKTGTWLWKVKSFYTAPITKFILSALSHLTFLVLISIFFLSELGPFKSVSDMSVVEWLCYMWVLGMLCEELAQMGSKQSKGLLKGNKTTSDVWVWYHRLALTPIIQKLIMYIRDCSWNLVDIIMLSLFLAATMCRFLVPLENFQIVRVLYSVSIIAFFVRFLRFFYIQKVIGPRIIALGMMFFELIYFLAILGVFLFSFGVAFQGLLHPEQPPSWQVLADIIWRPYWQMFGELFLSEGESSYGMGRYVGNKSCSVASEYLHGDKTLNCYSFIPSIFLGVYLFISNILLLNLLIAIFGNTLNSVEAISNTHWAFHQYSIVHEYYYKLWLPPPLNLLWYICAFLGFCIRIIYELLQFICKGYKKSTPQESKNEENNCCFSDHFRMHSIMDDKYMKQVDTAQKEALSIIMRRGKQKV